MYATTASETLTVQKTGDGAVNLAVADLYDNEIPQHIIDAGFTRVTGGTKYNVTDANGDRDTTPISVAETTISETEIPGYLRKSSDNAGK